MVCLMHHIVGEVGLEDSHFGPEVVLETFNQVVAVEKGIGQATTAAEVVIQAATTGVDISYFAATGVGISSFAAGVGIIQAITGVGINLKLEMTVVVVGTSSKTSIQATAEAGTIQAILNITTTMVGSQYKVVIM